MNKLIKPKLLFIDRDGTLILEPEDEQVDSFEKLQFYPEVFRYLGNIARELKYKLIMVTNQDGLGTTVYPEETFWPVQNFVVDSFQKEGVVFSEIHIDRTFAKDNAPTRKPNTGLLTHFMEGPYDMANSFVIGDRLTDVKLAKNLGCKGIFINQGRDLGSAETQGEEGDLAEFIALETDNWKAIYEFLRLPERTATVHRITKETDVFVRVDLDKTIEGGIQTGLNFFDHMLEQIAKHGQLGLEIKVKGDLEIDEHHTIEDTAITLGEAFAKAIGDKIGMERYGFTLPMDDCLAQVSLDFGGRPWLVWEAEFKREKVGDMPTEMFLHFFKSFSDASKSNLNIKAEGTNEHHKIEAIFKAFAKAIKMAIQRNPNKMVLPSTKGML